MKTKERATCIVKPVYFLKLDKEYVDQHGIKEDQYLIFDINMKELVRVDDLYKDQTTFFKTLVKGVGTASPYLDSLVACKFNVICQH